MTDEIDSDANNTHELTAEVARALIARGWRLTTAESCTGGNLAAALCAQADTAAFYDTGVVTFSDEAKRNVLQVRAETLAVHSAVSEACVQEMSSGILALAGADIAIAVRRLRRTGGRGRWYPAGTVWFAPEFSRPD